MTDEKRVVKVLADEIVKTMRSINSSTVNASKIVGLPSAISSVISGLSSESAGGDVISSQLLSALNRIAAGEFETITADTAQIEKLYATFGEFMNLIADHAQIGQLDVDDIRANMIAANLITTTYADIANAEIGRATLNHAFVRTGVGDKIYIDDLAVTNANIVTLAAGQILVKNSNGDMVELYVDSETGNVSTRAVDFDGDDIISAGADGVGTLNGNRIIENSITARRLNASEIFAANGDIINLVSDNIDAGRIHTGQLDAAYINASNLAAISADLGTITAGVLKSSNYSYSSGNYSSAGICLDFNNIYMRTPNFGVDSSGNVHAKAGDIAGWSISSTQLYKIREITENNITTEYKPFINAPTSPTVNNIAFGVSKRTKTSGGEYGDPEYPFMVRYGGTVELEGKIKASSGNIGGWVVSSTQLYKILEIEGTSTTTEYKPLMNAPDSPTSNTIAFAIRKRTKTNGGDYGTAVYPFCINYDGTGTIGGFRIISDRLIYKPNSTDDDHKAIFGIVPYQPVISGYTQDDVDKWPVLWIGGGRWSSAEADNTYPATTAPFRVLQNGELLATAGKIGGWTISSTQLYKVEEIVGTTTTTEYKPVLNAPSSSITGNTIAIAVRVRTKTNGGSYGTAEYPFCINYDGSISATKGSVGGWTLGSYHIGNNTDQFLATVGMASKSKDGAGAAAYSFWAGGKYYDANTPTAVPKFYVTPNGILHAEDANISGTIVATDGSIGDLNVSTNQMYFVNTNYAGIFPNQSEYVFAAGGSLASFDPSTSNITLQNIPFRVTNTGEVYVSSSTNRVKMATGSILFESYMQSESQLITQWRPSLRISVEDLSSSSYIEDLFASLSSSGNLRIKAGDGRSIILVGGSNMSLESTVTIGLGGILSLATMSHLGNNVTVDSEVMLYNEYIKFNIKENTYMSLYLDNGNRKVEVNSNLIMNTQGLAYRSIRFGSIGNTGTQYETISQEDWGMIYFQTPCDDISDPNNVTHLSSRFFFREYSPSTSATARTNYYETYFLPQADRGLTENKDYYILTSKNNVLISYGGTGADTWGGALNNLHIRYLTRSSMSTNQYGNVDFSLAASSYAIVSAYCTTYGYCVIPFKSAVTNNWHGYVIDAATNTLVTSASIGDVVIAYIGIDSAMDHTT